MTFLYEMCPHCMNRLHQRKQPMEDMDSVNLCPQCGNKMVMACFGEEEVDDTVYKIILNDAAVSDYEDRKNRFLSVLMKLGNISPDEALERYGTKDCAIFEGNVSNTYVNMHLLDEFTPGIHYTVVPTFPFERLIGPFTSLCPVCGSNMVCKKEDIDNSPDYVWDGYYCENCNEWFMKGMVNKLQLDETLYHLTASLKGIESKVREDILRRLDETQDKEVTENKIVVNDLAGNIDDLLRALKTYNIDYEVEPSYPYKIAEFKKEWTEEDIEQLIAVNPGLKLTAEEMNVL